MSLNSIFVQLIIGILGSLLVYFITSYISKKKGDKIYQERLKNANYEFISSLKSMLIEKKYYSKDYSDSIANTISRKYNIQELKLISIPEIVNDFILEISMSHFLDNNEKKKHITELLEIKKESLAQNKKVKSTSNISIDKNLNSSQIGILMSSITLASSIFMLLFSSVIDFNSGSSGFTSNSNSIRFLFMLSFLIVPILVTFLYQFKRTLSERKKYNYLRKEAYSTITRLHRNNLAHNTNKKC